MLLCGVNELLIFERTLILRFSLLLLTDFENEFLIRTSWSRIFNLFLIWFSKNKKKFLNERFSSGDCLFIKDFTRSWASLKSFADLY
jgi:hypothetical protein